MGCVCVCRKHGKEIKIHQFTHHKRYFQPKQKEKLGKQPERGDLVVEGKGRWEYNEQRSGAVSQCMEAFQNVHKETPLHLVNIISSSQLESWF